MPKTLVFTVVTLLVSCSNAGGQGPERDRGVTVDLAHDLAKSTLTETARHLAGMRFDAEKQPHDYRFYWFEITAKTPDDISPLLGYFAVNKINGDVWDPVACIKLNSPFIRSFKRTGYKGSAIKSLKRAPCEP